jgi:hypothetical protein
MATSELADLTVELKDNVMFEVSMRGIAYWLENLCNDFGRVADQLSSNNHGDYARRIYANCKILWHIHKIIESPGTVKIKLGVLATDPKGPNQNA